MTSDTFYSVGAMEELEKGRDDELDLTCNMPPGVGLRKANPLGSEDYAPVPVYSVPKWPQAVVWGPLLRICD